MGDEFLKNFNSQNFPSIGIAPTSLYIDHLQVALGDHAIKIGSQNIDIEEAGARTGEISASMIKDSGCTFCISVTLKDECCFMKQISRSVRN